MQIVLKYHSKWWTLSCAPLTNQKLIGNRGTGSWPAAAAVVAAVGSDTVRLHWSSWAARASQQGSVKAVASP